jgi:recombination protein RecA
VSKRGSFYAYGDIRLGQGRENAKTFLMENPDIAAEIDRKIRDNFGLPVNFVPATPAATIAMEMPAAPAAERSAGKAARGAMRPAVDEASIKYGEEGEAPSLFNEAA